MALLQNSEIDSSAFLTFLVHSFVWEGPLNPGKPSLAFIWAWCLKRLLIVPKCHLSSHEYPFSSTAISFSLSAHWPYTSFPVQRGSVHCWMYHVRCQNLDLSLVLTLGTGHQASSSLINQPITMCPCEITYLLNPHISEKPLQMWMHIPCFLSLVEVILLDMVGTETVIMNIMLEDSLTCEAVFPYSHLLHQ